jgi:hypothetical protein
VKVRDPNELWILHRLSETLHKVHVKRQFQRNETPETEFELSAHPPSQPFVCAPRFLGVLRNVVAASWSKFIQFSDRRRIKQQSDGPES